MNTKQKIKLVNEAFLQLNQVFYSEMRNYAEQLRKQCAAEEKEHRGWGRDFAKYHPTAETVNQVAKIFAVKRVAEYLLKPVYPKGKDYLHYLKSCFIAAGIAEEFGAKVCAVWSVETTAALAELDYCEFVQTGKRVA